MQEGLLLQGRYTVQQLIGRGAQGECWLVQEGEHMWLAKIYRLHQEGWERYALVEREAQILYQLSNPGIPAFRDMFVLPDDAALCLVREWLPGRNLEQFISQHRTSEVEVRQLARQLLETLHYIHSLSPAVIHRDIKPTNVILRPDGSLALIDFGSVRDVIFADQGASVVGTYGYTPPEQFLGHPTPASDLYALGATLVYLLSRQHPSSLPLLRNRLMFEPYINVQQRFLRILQRLLSPEVEDRFQSAREVMQALDRCDKTGGVTVSSQHGVRQLPIPTEQLEGLSGVEKRAKASESVRRPPWQRHRKRESQWTWEKDPPHNPNALPDEWQPQHPDLTPVIQTLQKRHHFQNLDSFSDPLEVVEAIDHHFNQTDETGREWLLRLLHPYDAADILFHHYDPTFLLSNYTQPLLERFSLLLTRQGQNAIGQWVLLYFLYKYNWHLHNQRLMHSPLKALKIQEHFPTRWGPLQQTRRFLEHFESLSISKQTKLYPKLEQHWEQLSRHYQLCISVRPSHLPVLVEHGLGAFEQECLSTYDKDFQNEWLDEGWFRRMLRWLTFWPPRWLPFTKMLGQDNRVYQRLGNYVASLHIVHALLEQHLLRLQDEYHWMLEDNKKS